MYYSGVSGRGVGKVLGRKGTSETRENIYIMTMVSHEPRQIIGFDIAFDKSTERIQNIVDNMYEAKYYCIYGYN